LHREVKQTFIDVSEVLTARLDGSRVQKAVIFRITPVEPGNSQILNKKPAPRIE
jgi:hypothetical protein